MLIGYSYYAEQTEPYDFGEFTIDVPLGSKFKDVTSRYDSENYNIGKAYICTDKDLIISIFDKHYIENTYEMNTGDKIDFGKSLLGHLHGENKYKINESSENLTFFILNHRVKGVIDTDVAGVYNDDDHLIIVEGGDIEFIEKIANSIKIKNT